MAAESLATNCGTLLGRNEQQDKGKAIVQFEETLDTLPCFGLVQVPGSGSHETVEARLAATMRVTSSLRRG